MEQHAAEKSVENVGSNPTTSFYFSFRVIYNYYNEEIHKLKSQKVDYFTDDHFNSYVSVTYETSHSDGTYHSTHSVAYSEH